MFDLPGAVFPTATRMLAPTSRFAVALLGRVGAATAEVVEESADDDGKPRYAAGDELGLSGLQRAFQDQLAGTAGFTVTVVSADENTGDVGREIAAVDPQPGQKLDLVAATDVLQRDWANGGVVALPITELPPTTTAEDVATAIQEVARPAVAAPITVNGENGVQGTVTPEVIAASLSFQAEKLAGGKPRP